MPRLTMNKKKALKSQGLNVSLLDDSQWVLLQKALATKGAVYAAAAKNSQLVQLTQSDTEYKFSFWPGGNEQPVTFKITYRIVYKTEDQLDIPKKSKK